MEGAIESWRGWKNKRDSTSSRNWELNCELKDMSTILLLTPLQPALESRSWRSQPRLQFSRPAGLCSVSRLSPRKQFQWPLRSGPSVPVSSIELPGLSQYRVANRHKGTFLQH